MANINHKWDSVMAFGCSHGHYANKKFTDALLGFADRFKPKHRIHLGDAFDFTAFRSGAKGTSDEAEPVDCDLSDGRELLRRFRPTVFCIGNHEDRIVKLARHHNTIIATAAASVLQDIEEPLKACKSRIIPYTVFNEGWYELGGFLYGHGHKFSKNYLAETANCWGNTVVAHAHRPGIARGHTRIEAVCYGVGTACDIKLMTYAKGKESTLAWAPAFVWGHVYKNKSSLTLTMWNRDETEFKMPI